MSIADTDRKPKSSRVEMDINEKCWVLRGRTCGWFWRAKFDRYTVGKPAAVAFDYNYVMEMERDLVGWIHTHPHWTASPSMTDVATMGAWVNCLGRPLLCVIRGTDGLRAHWFFSDEEPSIETAIVEVGGRLWGPIPRKIRKLLKEKKAKSNAIGGK